MADRKDADVFEKVQAFNDHGKLLAGVHENFLGVRFNDATLSKAAAALDWLQTADLMDARQHKPDPGPLLLKLFLYTGVGAGHAIPPDGYLAPTLRPLRPLNPGWLSPQERTLFRGLVDVRLSCGLTFAPQSASSPPPAASAPNGAAAAGAQEFALGPPIDQLLKYEGYDFAHHRLAPPSPAMVAHEVSLEAMHAPGRVTAIMTVYRKAGV
ncbi:unnamed protein product [Pylaiella littoralis]